MLHPDDQGRACGTTTYKSFLWQPCSCACTMSSVTHLKDQVSYQSRPSSRHVPECSDGLAAGGEGWGQSD